MRDCKYAIVCKSHASAGSISNKMLMTLTSGNDFITEGAGREVLEKNDNTLHMCKLISD